ncbi:hypothetical protein PSHT_02805 [Puccinia striiformis]|uniref:Uncharacterized protein n=1 Tax=Puccinia striiformis TaxID=27350 RepID=A0A2S4WGX0_9BASI|nr:hypothetical protein PSHT_02805 [Puccinia striiformis]
MLATASLKTEGQFDWVYWPVSVSDSELSCIIIKLFQGSIIYQHQTDSANPEDTLLASQQSLKSKYAHLKDYDTITDPKAPPKRKADNSAYNLFNQKFEELSKASNSGIWGGQIFAQAKVFKAPALPRRTDQLAAQQEVEDNKSFDQD